MVIPTNKPVGRKDSPDIIYKTEAIKFKMIAQEIVECHKKGQPVLVGTRSIEKSERVSKILTKLGIPHEVLNAKYHEKEAEIIKKAGEKGAVTIATNMAGRGVDIVLGNRVTELGGLHVLGTERHESRRIDNQLRGRSGRQGDPGSTRFFLSLDDELLRIFGGERITRIFDTLKIDEEMPLESKILTMAIENAQKKVEAYNFDIRKSLLEYDNVLNKQREIIYNERKRVLESIDIQEHVTDMMREIAEGLSHKVVTSDLRLENQYDILNNTLYEVTGTYPNFKDLDRVKDVSGIIFDYLISLYQKKEKMVGSEGMRNIEQQILIYIVDNKWKDHLYGMDHLKEGIGLRGYGQQDPLMVYQKEGFQMFEDMLGSIKEEVVQLLFKIQINPMVAKPTSKDDTTEGGRSDTNSKENQKSKREEMLTSKGSKKLKIGRNDPCPCGSGKKYKKCCGAGETDG